MSCKACRYRGVARMTQLEEERLFPFAPPFIFYSFESAGGGVVVLQLRGTLRFREWMVYGHTAHATQQQRTCTRGPSRTLAA